MIVRPDNTRKIHPGSDGNSATDPEESPEQRPSILAGLSAEASEACAQGRAEEELRAELARRASEHGAGSEAAHVAVAIVVFAVLQGSVPTWPLVGWLLSIVAVSALRRAAKRRIGETTPPRTIELVTRVTATASASAWSLGLIILAPQIPFPQLALVGMAMAGLAAGGTAFLVFDPVAYLSFACTLLLPVSLGLLRNGLDRLHVGSALLTLVFLGAMLVINRRAHLSLIAALVAGKRLTVADQQVRRERAQLEALLADAPTAIVTLSASGKVLGANAAFERLFGYTLEEALGQDLDDLIVPVDGTREARDLTERVVAGGTLATDVARKDKHGSLVHVHVSASVVPGVVDGALFVLYDDRTQQTRAEQALREAERHYRQLVESGSDLAWKITLDGRWTYLSSACRTVYGARADTFLGTFIWERIDPLRLEVDREAIHSVFAGGEMRDHETVHLSLDGTSRNMSLAARPLRDATGRIVGAHGTARDVTARVAERRALEEARALAEHTAQTKSAFLANMSHEIRTPMNGVLGMTELLLDTELDEEQRHSAQLIRSSANSLLTVINDILDFSKIESGTIEFEAIDFDVRSTIDSTVRLLEPTATEKQLRLEYHVAPELPERLNGDPGRLRQVLTNLIGNAIKFTDAGEVSVTADLEEERAGVSVVRFAVRDTGIGIPEDKREMIFGEFNQADASTTRRYGGTGLGLSISRRLVGMLGGELHVESAPDRGSTFSFAIPLVTSSGDAAHGWSPHALGDVQTLVVVHADSTRNMLVEMLRSAGALVQSTQTGVDGLGKVRQAAAGERPYGLVVLDAQMPDMDGFSMASRIKSNPALANTPLLMVTSGGQAGDGERCKSLGVAGYLPKSVPWAVFMEIASAIVAGRTPATEEGVLMTRHTIGEGRTPLRILLAEDNPVNQQVAAGMLRKRGHEVDIVNNGQEAVDAARASEYNLVLMDVQMPTMDGLTATQEIRATPGLEQLPIVALTAHALTEERQRCLEAGMNSYLAKPFQPHELFEIVESQARGPGLGASPQGSGPVAGGDHPLARPPAGNNATSVVGAEAASPTSSAPPPVDLDAFRGTMREAGIESAVDMMLEVFRRDAPERIEAILVAVEQRNARQIAAAAHAFKSAASTICARELAHLLADAESAGRAEDVDHVVSIVGQIRDEALAVLDYLGGSLASVGGA